MYCCWWWIIHHDVGRGFFLHAPKLFNQPSEGSTLVNGPPRGRAAIASLTNCRHEKTILFQLITSLTREMRSRDSQTRSDRTRVLDCQTRRNRSWFRFISSTVYSYYMAQLSFQPVTFMNKTQRKLKMQEIWALGPRIVLFRQSERSCCYQLFYVVRYSAQQNHESI